MANTFAGMCKEGDILSKYKLVFLDTENRNYILYNGKIISYDFDIYAYFTESDWNFWEYFSMKPCILFE